MDAGTRKSEALITFVAVAFQRYRQLPVLVHSLLAQTDDRWELVVIHDGPDERHQQIGGRFAELHPERIAYIQTAKRHGCFGHPLRAVGLEIARAPWVCLTNDDNYYAPTFVATMLGRARVGARASVVACNMVHNHERDDYVTIGSKAPKRYGVLNVRPRKAFIDIGCFIARTELARVVGFKGTEHDSDGDYLEGVIAAGRAKGLEFAKVRQVLFVHN